MNGSVFEKVLLPAILTSCTVFSALTLGFLPRRAQPILTEPATGESIEAINHRDIIIRHIGLSIVVSVGAGITTAELMRKWGRSRSVAIDGRHVLSAQTTLQAVDMPDMAMTVNRLTASLHGLTSGMVPTDRLEVQTHSLSVLESDRDVDWDDPALPLSLFQPPVLLPTEDVNWFPLTQPDSALPMPFTELSFTELSLQAADWAPTWHPILASRDQYQTCRIHRSDAPERLFAILFEGQYYRFIKAAIDQQQARSIATTLEQRGESAVITHTDERYTVWALEPDACPETIISGADSVTCACVEHLVAA